MRRLTPFDKGGQDLIRKSTCQRLLLYKIFHNAAKTKNSFKAINIFNKCACAAHTFLVLYKFARARKIFLTKGR